MRIKPHDAETRGRGDGESSTGQVPASFFEPSSRTLLRQIHVEMESARLHLTRVYKLVETLQQREAENPRSPLTA